MGFCAQFTQQLAGQEYGQRQALYWTVTGTDIDAPGGVDQQLALRHHRQGDLFFATAGDIAERGMCGCLGDRQGQQAEHQ